MLKLPQPNASRPEKPDGVAGGGPRNPPPEGRGGGAAQTGGRHRGTSGGHESRLEKANAAVKADEATKKFETAIQDLQGKISKYRDQSLDVKTNDQYKALLHEIQFAESEIRANEDQILELMVNAEAREKQVKAAEAELKAETAEIEKEKAIAREKTAEDEKLLAEWNGKRTGSRRGERRPAAALRAGREVPRDRAVGSAPPEMQRVPDDAASADLQRGAVWGQGNDL